MDISTTRVKVDEFERFIALPENADRRFELIRGVIVEMSPAQLPASAIAVLIAHFLLTFVRPRGLGHVAGADGGFKLSREDFFVPDVSFISKTRLPRLQKDFGRVVPDLAVEVVLPSDSLPGVHAKAMRYLELGTRRVWVVYPGQQVIDVYQLSEQGALVRRLGLDGVLDGGDVLSGFTLPARDVFSIEMED